MASGKTDDSTNIERALLIYIAQIVRDYSSSAVGADIRFQIQQLLNVILMKHGHHQEQQDDKGLLYYNRDMAELSFGKNASIDYVRQHLRTAMDALAAIAKLSANLKNQHIHNIAIGKSKTYISPAPPPSPLDFPPRRA